MKYIELFAGVGGMSEGFDRAGWECAAHAEIDANARSVLRLKWPDTMLLGDVVALSGGRKTKRWLQRTFADVDVVSGGSPCQDLSVAGKRAGIDGLRSSLFFRQARIWKLLKNAPYFIWENVPGALISAGGADFAIVLSTIVGGTVDVPDGGWGSGGVVAGADAVAAYRVLDLQYFGPAHRRARVFVLGARAGALDPAECLALSEAMCGHPSPRARSAEEDPELSREIARRRGGTVAPTVAGTLGTVTGGVRTTDLDGIGAYPVVFKPSHFTRGKDGAPSEIVPPLSADADKGDQDPIIFDPTHTLVPDVADTLGGNALEKQAKLDGIGAYPVTYGFNWQNGGGYGNANDGLGITKGAVPPISRSQTPAVVMGIDVMPTLGARDWKGPGNIQNGGWLQDTVFPEGRPRRLLPIECERLMGWEDGWTLRGITEQGKHVTLSDTARKRVIGNGVGSPCAEWIARRING